MRATNPYNYNLPVRPDMFFGRQQDVETLRHHLIATPGDSLALIGGRRIGKTSLLEALLRELEPSVQDPKHSLLTVPILLDLTGGGVDSVVTFFCTIGERAQATLADLLVSPLGDAFSTGEGLAPALAFGRVLQQWGKSAMAQRGCRLRLILLLDECEQIVEQPWTPELYRALRYLLVGQATRSLLKVVMAGSHRFLTQVRQRGSPLRNVLKYHRLGVLDAQATRDLIVQPTGGILVSEVIQAVAAQSGGHPFLTQYIMHHLWEQGLESATPEKVDQIAAMFTHERSDFWDWAEGLGDSGMAVYSVLSKAREPLAESDIRAALHSTYPDLLQALDALCYHGLLVQEADGQGYRVTGRMFQEWFAINVAQCLEQSTLRQLSGMPQALDAERRQNLLEQLAIERANLNELELQRAHYGIRAPLDLINEIKVKQRRIEEIERELERLGSGARSSRVAAAGPKAAERTEGLRIDSGGGAVIFGDVHVEGYLVGRDMTVTCTGAGLEEVAALFERAVELARAPERPQEEREDLEVAVETVRQEMDKGEEADTSLLKKALDVLLDKAPDLLEIVLEAILNPAAAAGKGARMLAREARKSLEKRRKGSEMVT